MRTSAKIFLAAIVAAVALPFAGAAAHNCEGGHTHTAAGSCKQPSDGTTKCAPAGAPGELPASAGSVRLFVNPAEEEIEACNDQGAGTTTGRLIVNGDSQGRFVRVSLDSTEQQPDQVKGGYIIVQAGQDPSQTGVWCSATGGSGDGYSRPRNTPGPEGGNVNNPAGWAQCIPTQ